VGGWSGYGAFDMIIWAAGLIVIVALLIWMARS
jgi:hypothetical protein